MNEFTSQNRGGKGIRCYKIIEKTGNVVGVKAVNEDDEIMIINTEGIIIRTECTGISKLGRITSGVKLINLDTMSVLQALPKSERPRITERKRVKTKRRSDRRINRIK